MFSEILCYFLAIAALSSAAVVRQHDLISKSLTNPSSDINNEPFLYVNYVGIPPPAPQAPSRTEIHTVAKEDTTVDKNALGSTVENSNQRTTLRTSDRSNEVTDEASHTIAEERADGSGDVLHANGQKTQYLTTSPDGVKDSYLKQELTGVYGVKDPNGDNRMYSTSSDNHIETVSDPYGLDETMIVSNDQDFQASETADGIKTTGNTATDITYGAGKDEDVETLYLIKEKQNVQRESNQQGLAQSNVQTNIAGIGYGNDVKESLGFNQNDQKTSLTTDGVETTVGVTKKNGQYNSADSNGNEELLLVDATNHDVQVKDGDFKVALSRKDTHDVQGTKDPYGVTSLYKGDKGDQTLTISDGEVTSVLGKDQSNAIYGFYNEDGSRDVHQVTEAGKTAIVADNEEALLMRKNEIKKLDGTIDDGGVKDVHTSNQVDNTVIVANSQGGQGRKTSTIDEVYKVADSQGNLGVVNAGGSTVTQTVVLRDDYDDYGQYWVKIEAPKVDEGYVVGIGDGYDASEVINEATPKPNDLPEVTLSGNTYQGPSAGMVLVNKGTVNINQNTYSEPEGTQSSSSSTFGELIKQLENLYNHNTLNKLGSIFGGVPKVDVQIKLNMEI